MFRSTIVCAVSLVLIVLASSLVTAQVPAAADPGTPTFDESMSNLNRAFRKIRRSERSAGTLEADLVQVSAFQAAIVAAKSVAASLPMAPQASEAYGGDQAVYLKALRLSMNQLLSEAVDLEKAMLAGDAEAMEKHIVRINAMKASGHEDFQSD